MHRVAVHRVIAANPCAPLAAAAPFGVVNTGQVSAVSIVLPSEILLRGPDLGSTTIGLLLPLSGLMGIAGPAILNCAILAAEHLNESSGRLLEFILIDAGRPVTEVANEVAALAHTGLVDGLVGTHTSDVRVAVEAVLPAHVPYVFTPPHETVRRRDTTVYLGADPEKQLRQPLEWVAQNHRATRWAFIGNDYIWPQTVHAAARRLVRRLGDSVVMERLVPIGQVDVAQLVDAARSVRADALLLSLVGRDGIAFQRGITEMGAGDAFLRLSTAMDETCLVASGGDTTGRLFSAMPSFVLQTDDRHNRLLEAYLQRFGTTAPLPGSYAEGCYDGVHLLAAMLSSGLLASAAAGVVASRLRSAAPSPASAASARQSRLIRLHSPLSLALATGTELQVVASDANR